MPAPRAAEIRLSSITRFSKPCAEAGAAAAAEKSRHKSPGRRKFGTMTVSPMIPGERSNCRAKSALSWRGRDSLVGRGARTIGDGDGHVAVANPAFLERPADRRRPRRAQFEP